MIRLAACALAAVVAVPGAAGAGVRCQQLTDPSGDGRAWGVAPHRPSLDALSAGVATGPTSLVAVLRVASLAPDPALSAGVTYEFTRRNGLHQEMLEFHRFTNGDSFGRFDANSENYSGSDARGVTAVTDEAAGTNTWTVPRRATPTLGKGVTLRELTVRVYPTLNVGVVEEAPYTLWNVPMTSGDIGFSDAVYADRTPTCLKVT